MSDFESKLIGTIDNKIYERQPASEYQQWARAEIRHLRDENYKLKGEVNRLTNVRAVDRAHTYSPDITKSPAQFWACRATKAEAEVERLKLMVKSITGGLDEAIETNQYLGKQLDKAIEDIEILCTKHYELADDYDKLSDICQDFCLHTDGKCFKAAADNPNRCAKFRWRG